MTPQQYDCILDRMSPPSPPSVLMLSDVYFPRINGVSTSIATFRHELATLGIRVQLVAPEYPDSHDAPDVWRVPARRLPFDPEDRLMRWRHLTRLVERIADVDLVHIQTPFAAHHAGLRIGRHLGVPVLATYHTHFEEYIGCYLPLLPRPVLRAAARRLARSQCNGLDAVVVPSTAMARRLGDYGVTTPLHVLPTGIPLGHFGGGDGADFRHRHGIEPERPVALYVGRVAHEKNIDFLLEATALAVGRQPDLLLLIAGEGPALTFLRRRQRALGLTDHVRFVGYLDRQRELPDCYAAANLFVFASRTETQGLVLLEAMAAGLPVYALAEMGTRDILAPQRGSVAAPDDAEGFAAGRLVELLRDRPRLAALASEARHHAEEWSAPPLAARLAGLYRALVHNRAP